MDGFFTFCKAYFKVFSRFAGNFTEYLEKSYSLAKKIYSDKLYQRLGMWEDDCLQYLEIIINGKKYRGFPYYKNLLDEKMEYLAQSAVQHMTIIHGDLVFSNILYSAKYGFFKLIDARGEFGENTIFGDVRYDIAKLRQCYHGLYDVIVNDSFEISRTENDFSFHSFSNRNINWMEVDKMLTDYGYDIDEIKWIECLLFLSMIPLHSDKISRQVAFFLKAIILLDEIFCS